MNQMKELKMRIDDLRNTLSSGCDIASRFDELAANIDEREKIVLAMRLGVYGSRPRSVSEICQELGRSRNVVYRIQKQALEKIQTVIVARLEPFRLNDP